MTPEPPTSPDPTEPVSHPVEGRCFCGFPMVGGRACPTHGHSVRVPEECEHQFVEVEPSPDALVFSRTFRCMRGCGTSRVQA